MSEYVVLCEGYYDRAFWAGWLQHLGCREAVIEGNVFVGTDSGAGKGHWGYHSTGGKFVRIVPCGGKPNVLREARDRL